MLTSWVSRAVIKSVVILMDGLAFSILIAELFAKSLQFRPSKTLAENVQFSSFVVLTA